jgi:hypothetical protein
MRRHTKTRSKRQLSTEQLQRREAIFALYRDMGPGRSYERLIETARPRQGPVSKRTLVNWSQQHNWRALIAEHDQRLSAVLQPPPVELGANFDRVDALSRIADRALQRVLQTPGAKPRELKTLVEIAEKAVVLAEKLRGMGMARRSPEEADEHSQKLRRVLAFMDQAARAKHAAEGHPVRDHVMADEPLDEEPDRASDAAPLGTASPDATVH